MLLISFDFMSLRQYLATMIIATILCWTAWFFVLLNVDPFYANALSFSFFYIGLLLSLAGTLSILLFFVYRVFNRRDLPLFKYVRRSFSESMLISGFLVFVLFLKGQGYINFWNGIILAAIFILIISFKFSLKFPIHTNNTEHI